MPVAFGLGKAEFVQIITSNNSYTAYTYTYDDPNDGITGLDTSYPYDNYTYLEGSTTPFSDGDSPGFSIYEEDTFVTLGLSATTYVMYLPPGGDMWVPLGQLAWSANESATLPALGERGYYTTPIPSNPSDWAGTVGPTTAGSMLNFVNSNAFPSWTTIITQTEPSIWPEE